MHKVKVGLFCIFMSCVLGATNDVTMTIDGGHKMKEKSGGTVLLLASNEGYSLSIECPGEPTSIEVEGSELFQLHAQGHTRRMNSLNGKTELSVSYTYRLMPLATGSYTLGPARVTIGKQEYASNRIRLKVVDQVKYDKIVSLTPGRKRSQLQCRLESSAPEVTVGENVEVRVVMQDGGDVLGRSYEQPLFDGMRVVREDDPVTEQIVENGMMRIRTTKAYTLIADEPGSYTIGPARAHFSVRERRARKDPFTDSFFGSFASSMFGGVKERVIASEPLKITVLDLPQTAHAVDGIGQFESFTARTDHSDVTINEPITLLLTLQGSGNFDAITPPSVYVPSSMTVYNSEQRMEHDVRGVRKIFEYVVQVAEPGSHTIPEQSFVYFDTSAREYKTLRTEPVVITVAAPVVHARSAEGESGEPSEEMVEQDVPLVETNSSWMRRVMYGLSWWWFVLLLILFFIVLVYKELSGALIAVLQKKGFLDKYAGQRRRLKKIIAEKDLSELNAFFGLVTGSAVLVKPSSYEREPIVNYARERWKWTEKKAEDLGSYLTTLRYASFGPSQSSQSNHKKLWTKAEYWFEAIIAESKRKGKKNGPY